MEGTKRLQSSGVRTMMVSMGLWIWIIGIDSIDPVQPNTNGPIRNMRKHSLIRRTVNVEEILCGGL